MQVKKIIKECIVNVLKENLSLGDIGKTKQLLYQVLEKYGFRWKGSPPNDLVEYGLNGVGKVECGVDHWKKSVFIKRIYDEKELDNISGYHIEKHIMIPKIYSDDFVKRIASSCCKLKNTIKNKQPLDGEFDELQEGFDPTSMGPNIEATEGTQDNPYPAWNAKMRQMEEGSAKPGKSTCQQCKGTGQYVAKLRNPGNGTYNTHIVPCDFPGCHNGTVDHEENYHALMGGKCHNNNNNNESVDVNVPEKKCYHYTPPEDKTSDSTLPIGGEKKYYRQLPGGEMGASNVATLSNEDISSNPHGRYAQVAGADGFDSREFRVNDGFDEFRKEIGSEKVNEFLAKFGLGPSYKPTPKKTYKCPKCKNHNATYKVMHEDTDMEEMELNCPDCNKQESHKSFQEIRNQHDPDGTKHDLTLKCIKCGTTETCRCSKPKRKMSGICDKCSKLK